MDRQLSVWAAPGLVLLVALIAAFTGHLPAGLVPERGARPQPVAAVPAADAGAPSGRMRPLGAVQQPSRAAEPSEPASRAEPPVEPKQTPVRRDPVAGPASHDGPTGVVEGRIVYEGAPPAQGKQVSVPADQLELCCNERMDLSDRSLRVAADGGVADVVVLIKAKGAEANGAGREVEMDQRCCRFEPHVLVVPRGATLRYKNSDETNHNVHTYSKKNKQINSSVAPASSMTSTLEKDEQFRVGCDIHPWMKAQIFVAEYETAAVTTSDGTFRIEGVPPGEWSFELWSESLRKGSGKVTVAADATTSVEWSMKKK